MKIHSKYVPTAALTALTCMALTACSSGAASEATADGMPTGTLTLAHSGEITTFDPAQAVLLSYYQPVYDTLIKTEADGKLSPMLASEWTYDDSLTHLTLKLRDDVTFSDGTPFNADAVVANLDHQIAATTSPLHSDVESIEGVAADGPSTVTLALNTPDPGLLDSLSMAAGMMAAPATLESGDLSTTAVGTGPYTLDSSSTTVGDTYTYKANPNYWDKSAIKFGTVVIKTMPDTTARLNALQSGEVQGSSLDLTQLATADSAGLTVQTKRDDWLGVTFYDRDGTMVPALGDVRVRQAIAYAVDEQALIKAFRPDHADATYQVFGPESDAYVPDLDSTYAHNVEKAKSLMAEAGYADGFDVTIPDLGQLFGADIYAAVIDQLRAIGVRVSLDSQPIPNLVQGAMSGKYAMAIAAGTLGSAWDTISTFFLPTSQFNPMHTETPELTTLIEAVRNSTGDEQKQAYQAVNEYLVDNAWAFPLFRDDTVYATTSDVKVTLQSGVMEPYIYNFSPAA